MLSKTELETTAKKVELNVKINHTKIFGDYCLFMRMISKNDRGIADQIDFGICKEQELEKLINNPHLPPKDVLEKRFYMLLKSSFKEDLRTDYHGTRNKLQDYMAKQSLGFMMEFAKTETKTNYFLAEYISGPDEFIDVESGVVLARSYTVDYINGHLHDSYYDLEQAAELLKKRRDVKLGGDLEKNFIQEIPYYNQFVAQKFIEFTWQPTQEDFNKMRESGVSSTNDVYDYIMNVLLKLTKNEKKEGDDD